ncbi:MAG: ATP-binding cassette domain-containing protein [Salinisphaera sp.]|nr:ATP-binding cassette domain-containing protein [Salinisphaera sp.]
MAPRLAVEALALPGIGPVTFSLSAGECLGLSGPSGAGKTRVLRAIADLDCHRGCCRLDGVQAHAMPAHRWRRRVAYLAADSAWWHDKVAAHIEAVEQPALEELGFDADVRGWPVSRLSSGERQRLALLRQLALQPSVLLLDEPVARLDPRNSALMVALLERYRRQQQAALVWVDHDRDLLIRVATRRASLDAGGGFLCP